MKEKNNNPISQNIKKYRLLNNMTQEELAGKLYLDTQYYAQLERGERNFTIEKIIQACTIFHVGIEDIIEINPTNTEDTSILIESIQNNLKTLSYTQLSILNKFIQELLPYMK